MNATVVKRPENLKEDRKVLSPLVIEEPLYQCAVSVTVLAYEPNATIDVDVDGTVTSAPGGFPFPNGVTIPLPAPLVAGQKVKARQQVSGVKSPWTAVITVGDHTKDFPAGPPRPQVTVYRGGANQGTWPCWGGSIVINGFSAFTSGETFSATLSRRPVFHSAWRMRMESRRGWIAMT